MGIIWKLSGCVHDRCIYFSREMLVRTCKSGRPASSHLVGYCWYAICDAQTDHNEELEGQKIKKKSKADVLPI